MSSKLFPSVLILALAACANGRPAAETPAVPPAGVAADDAIDRANLREQLGPYIESFGRDWSEAQQFSGFVLVARGDDVLYERGFGYADRARKTVPTRRTSFRTGSVTKQFTAAAILLLQEQGRLSVDDPISKHLPEYPEVGAGVTLHQLLTHTSGIPSYTRMRLVMADQARPWSVDELMKAFWNEPLEYAPGSRFSYNNSGYIILGAIIERITGKSYAEYLHETIFAPVGMQRTEVGDAPGLEDRADGYQVSGGRLVPANPLDMSVPYAGGAIRSTAADLWAWHRALLDGRVLSPAALELYYRPQIEDYAYGWVVHELEGRPVVEHNGGINGFTTAFIRVVEPELVVIVWSNNEVVPAQPIAEAAVHAAFGKKLEPVPQDRREPFDPEVAARAAGTYVITAAAREQLRAAGLPDEAIATLETVALSLGEGVLVMKPAGQPPVDLSSIGGAKFAAPELGLTVEVTLGEGGAPAKGLRILQGPLNVEFVRQ